MSSVSPRPKSSFHGTFSEGYVPFLSLYSCPDYMHSTQVVVLPKSVTPSRIEENLQGDVF